MQGSRFHICKDGRADDASRPGVNAQDQVLDEPIEVSYRFTAEPLHQKTNNLHDAKTSAVQ